MIYTPMTIKAMQLCLEAHKNQVDKGGMSSGDSVRRQKTGQRIRKREVIGENEWK